MQGLMSDKPIQCSRETNEGMRSDNFDTYEEAKVERNLKMNLNQIPLITGLDIIEDRETDSDSDSIGG
jgi:hypothetical protein